MDGPRFGWLEAREAPLLRRAAERAIARSAGQILAAAWQSSARAVPGRRARQDPSAGSARCVGTVPPMVRHVVCFRWKEGMTPEPVAFKFGPDMGVNAANWDSAVVADFDSIDDQGRISAVVSMVIMTTSLLAQ